jgi:hypothetical protein
MRPAFLSETSRSHGLGEFARWRIGRSTGAELPNRDAKLLCLVGEIVLNPGTREMQHAGPSDDVTLERNALIRRQPGVPRSIELLVPPQRLPILQWLQINQSPSL